MSPKDTCRLGQVEKAWPFVKTSSERNNGHEQRSTLKCYKPEKKIEKNKRERDKAFDFEPWWRFSFSASIH